MFKLNFFSIQGDLPSRNLQVHRQNLQVAMMKGENQEDQNQGLREGRKRKSTGQDPSTLAAVKRLMVLCHFPDSLGVQKADVFKGEGFMSSI